MIDAAQNALANEFPLFGESVFKFEEEFAYFCGSKFAVGVGSGTDALIFSLMASDVEGKEVVTSPASYIATANAAIHSKATPVFCDIDQTNNIDHSLVEKKIGDSKKIKAIVPVHLHGYPAPMNELLEIVEGRDIFLVEDAAQAHGAIYFGKRTGALGHIGCFSFNPYKNISVGGEGGMITTNDEEIAEKIRMIADAGRENRFTHEHKIIGFSSRLSTVSAAVGRVQLRYLQEWNEKRRTAASIYRKLLADVEEIVLPPDKTEIHSAYNKFAIKTNVRDALKQHLNNNDIESDPHYPIPIHMQPPYQKMGYKRGNFPNAENFAATTLSLPMFVDITKEEIGEVCEVIRNFFEM